MVGLRLIIVMAVVGGLIAYIADKMGSKIGKQKLSLLGLRPRYTATLLSVLSGIIISVLTIGAMAIASESARTALFGMGKLQQELRTLNEEKKVAAQSLEQAKADMEEKNKEVARLDEAIRENQEEQHRLESRVAWLNGKYSQAQGEVQQLTESRDKLTAEVKELEESTERLRQGLINLREGQIFYRSGEVVCAAIMKGGRSHEENIRQFNVLLQRANDIVLSRLRFKKQEDNKKIQALLVSSESLSRAIEVMDGSKADKVVRLRTLGNIMLGELVVCDIELTDNNLVFAKDELIYAEEYELDKEESPNGSFDALLMRFLGSVNHKAVGAGVLPDPLTGKVGSMDAATLIEASHYLRSLAGGRVVVKAYARDDISTAGPVQVRLAVERLDG